MRKEKPNKKAKSEIGMNIITVVPISDRNIKEELSYFTQKDVKVGYIVSAPVRNKNIPALIIKKNSALESKTLLKSTPYSLKKIKNVISKDMFSAEAVKAAKNTADYYASGLGVVLKSIIPSSILESEDINSDNGTFNKKKNEGEKLLIQSPLDDRLSFYKKSVRESFVKKRSTFIVVPTKLDIEKMEDFLKKGIDSYVFTFHGDMKESEIISKWEKALKSEHPILIIGTPLFLGLSRGDILTYILEKESSNNYKSIKNQSIDLKYFTEQLAEVKGVKIIFGDDLLSVETLWRYFSEEIAEVSPLRFKTASKANVNIIDMSEQKERTKYIEERSFLSSDMLSLLKNSNKEKTFIFSARRGLSPTTICKDCGYTFSCPNCLTPVILHSKKDDKRIFLCHRCGTSKEVEDFCPSCGSWRISQIGVGSELVESVLKKVFPKRMIKRLDSDTTKGKKDIENKLDSFFSDSGSILIGTELALRHIISKRKEVDNTIVASLDSLLTIPDFSISEKIMHILLDLKSISKKDLLFQSRIKDHYIISCFLDDNLSRFYREEIKLREKLSYPPFFVIITITFLGNKTILTQKLNMLKNEFKDQDPVFFTPYTEKVKNKFIRKAMIRVPRDKWPEKKILGKLLALSPEYKVSVDPPNII